MDTGVSPAIIEKDFWVCWTLEQLFASELANNLIFKGGTSLSKVYKATERFSEDIDLTIKKDFLGIAPESLPHSKYSNTKNRKLVDGLNEKAIELVQEDILALLKARFAAPLNGFAWGVRLIEPPANRHEKLTVLFDYPAGEDYSGNNGYIKPEVRLEFGASGDITPHHQASVCPYIAEILIERVPSIFNPLPVITVSVLDAIRTFWEKATILHSWHYVPADKSLGKVSRHMYDVIKLCEQGYDAKAKSAPDLLAAVVLNKKSYFPDSTNWYDTATPGSLKLTPPESRHKELRADYTEMQQMCFSSVPSFEQLLSLLQKIESELNRR